MTKTNPNIYRGNVSQIRAMFEGPVKGPETTSKPKVFKQGLNSVKNTTQPEAKLPSPKATGPEGKKSPPAEPKKTRETKQKYKELKQQHEANLLSKSVAPQVAERQATPKQQKPTVPQKPKGLTKPKVPPKPEGLLKKSGFSKSPASSIKPGNSEEQAKIHENDRAEKLEEILQNISARKIQGHWKKFFKNLSAIKTNDYGYKKTTYKGDYIKGQVRRRYTKVDENGKEYFYEMDKDSREYYFKVNDNDKNKTQHVVYFPGTTDVPRFGLGGSFKCVAGMDGRFVGFKTVEMNCPLLDANLNNIDDLVGTSTVIPAIAVDGDTMIARFGGQDLTNSYKWKEPCVFAHFENAVKDLKTLHERKTFLADIKPRNLVYDGENIKFIDVDDRIRMNEVFNFHCWRTEDYITEKLLSALDKTKETISKMQGDEMIQFQRYLKTADEYAFLLCMLEHSTKKEVRLVIDQATKNFNLKKDISDEEAKTFFDWRRAYLRNAWIEANVKPEFHSTIESMLRDPFEYSTNSTDQPYLSEMLDFSKKS